MKLAHWIVTGVLGFIPLAHGSSTWNGSWFGSEAELVFWYENSAEPFLFEHCKMELPLELSATALRTGTLRIDCIRSDGMSFEHTIPAAVFTVSQDGSLYNETMRVGRVTATRIDLEVTDLYSGVHYFTFTQEKTAAGQDGVGVKWYFRPELVSPFDFHTRAPLTRTESSR